MSESKSSDPSEWLHPKELMRRYQLKMKKRALQARMQKASTENKPITDNVDTKSSTPPAQKRKNPFAKIDNEKKLKIEEPPPSVDLSQDSTLFELLNIQSESTDIKNTSNSTVTFKDALTKVNENAAVIVEPPKGEKNLPIDWTLSSKMRIMSFEPFPWTGLCRSNEEASGITGFVRTLDIGEDSTTLDSGPKARFRQCCLVWQHPSLPWLQLFPRIGSKSASTLGNSSGISGQPMQDALYKEWCESYRSLFQLLRSRQCPYFYLCTNSFTALFRAAGICGIPEMHVIITPTSKAFRETLQKENIYFKTPLKRKKKRHSGTDSGFDSNSSTTNSVLNENDEDEDDDESDEEEWLKNMGFDMSQIHLAKKKPTPEENEVINTESLICVTGIEVQGLFNYLLNCKSLISKYGSFAGVPPTLLSPVAFLGGTLKPIKARSSIEDYDDEKVYSLELKGPILPHLIPSLCNLMKSYKMKVFTMSCAHETSTKAFSKEGNVECNGKKDALLPYVFGQEGLSDCGFNKELLSLFCNSDAKGFGVLDCLKYTDGFYIWE